MEIIKIEELTESTRSVLDELNSRDTPAVITVDGGHISALVIPLRENGIEMSILYALAEESEEKYGALTEFVESDSKLRSDPESAQRSSDAAANGRAVMDELQVLGLRYTPSEVRQQILDAVKESDEHPERRRPYVRKTPRTLKRDPENDTEHLLSSPENERRLMESMKAVRAGMYTERELLENDDVETS